MSIPTSFFYRALSTVSSHNNDFPFTGTVRWAGRVQGRVAEILPARRARAASRRTCSRDLRLLAINGWWETRLERSRRESDSLELDSSWMSAGMRTHAPRSFFLAAPRDYCERGRGEAKPAAGFLVFFWGATSFLFSLSSPRIPRSFPHIITPVVTFRLTPADRGTWPSENYLAVCVETRLPFQVSSSSV